MDSTTLKKINNRIKKIDELLYKNEKITKNMSANLSSLAKMRFMETSNKYTLRDGYNNYFINIIFEIISPLLLLFPPAIICLIKANSLLYAALGLFLAFSGIISSINNYTYKKKVFGGSLKKNNILKNINSIDEKIMEIDKQIDSISKSKEEFETFIDDLNSEKIKLNYLINDNDSLSNEKNKVYKKIYK